MGTTYETDVLIIGAGAVGTALARELSKYELKVIVCDKNEDVGGDASKSCSSCVATPATMPVGTLEQEMRAVSHPIVYRLCEELDVPVKMCGSLTLAMTDEQMDAIPEWLDKARQNGVYDAEFVTREEILEMEPAVSPDVKGGIYIARDGQIDQFLFVSAQAENAAQNGVTFLLECPVEDIIVKDGSVDTVKTPKGDIRTKWVVNAAGMYSDDIAAMVGLDDFTVHPRRGEFFVLDRDTPTKVTHIIRTITSGGSGHGTLIIPTVDGNILVGPDAEDIDDKRDKSTTDAGLDLVKKQASQLVPGLVFRDTITQFAGFRAVKDPEGYSICVSDEVMGYVGITGIRSTGLSSSPGIALYAVNEMKKAGLPLKKKAGYQRYRKGIVRFRDASDEEKSRLIEENPLYGRIICRCEKITEAEIREAIRRPVGAKSLDSIKRRVRAGMGRCQGGFCSPLVLKILAEELGVPETEIRKRGGDSYVLEHDT